MILTKKVSVIIPALNEQHVIEQMINSIFAQTILPKEIILVDSGSTDKTVELATESHQKQKKSSEVDLKILYLKKALPGYARNYGIQNSACELVAFLDCGVFPNKNWLEDSINYIAKGYQISFGRCLFLADDFLNRLAMAYTYGLRSIVENTIPGSVFKIELWEKTNGFPENLRAGEDIIWRNEVLELVEVMDSDHKLPLEYQSDFKCFNSIFRKHFVYSKHLAKAKLIHKSPWLFFFFYFYLILAPIKLPMVIFYLLIRGILFPFVRSKKLGTLIQIVRILSLGLPFVVVLDFFKFAGYYLGMISKLIPSLDSR